MKVELNEQEVREALVFFAARKVGFEGQCLNSIEIKGVLTKIGDGPLVIVDITPVSKGGRG